MSEIILLRDGLSDGVETWQRILPPDERILSICDRLITFHSLAPSQEPSADFVKVKPLESKQKCKRKTHIHTHRDLQALADFEGIH